MVHKEELVRRWVHCWCMVDSVALKNVTDKAARILGLNINQVRPWPREFGYLPDPFSLFG
jgi:hypothetical protein